MHPKALPSSLRASAFLWAFFTAVAAEAAWPPALPSTIDLSVKETTGVARTAEVVRSGVPLPRSLDIRNTATLAVVNGSGTLVPAEFRVLARWNAGLSDTSAPIQWLLVGFSATVGANATATYRLVTDGSSGSNPAPSPALSISQPIANGQVTVSTGTATFHVGGTAGALFDDISLSTGPVLVSGSAMTARVNGTDTNHTVTRAVRIESSGPLSAVVVVEGEYDLPAVGGGVLSSRRRYVFTQGSRTAVVQQSAAWEGSLCTVEVIDCGAVNALKIEQIQDALSLGVGSPLSATAVGSFAAAAVQGTVAGGQTASVRQLLRADRTVPLSFSVAVPGTGGASGAKADGAVLSAAGPNGGVAVALNHMHRFEPQALRILSDGRLAIDLADDFAYIGNHQGLFATLAVGIFPNAPARSDLDRDVWAPVNHPLRAWPTTAWFGASGAVDEVPVGTLPANLTGYDSLLTGILDNTVQDIDSSGIAGLMTFGLYPRIWGFLPVLTDETSCGGGNPTPSTAFESWAETYWCSTWTDYHSTVAAVPMYTMRSGDVQWLDELATPGALRMLHTQIFQCAPGDPYFYCGQSPSGYGGYRQNFNSSHAYFDNLFLYYWLTGDYTVVDTLKRGSSTMRAYFCTGRDSTPGTLCGPNTAQTDDFNGLTGRVAAQWLSTFRFVGLASDDASYLDDFKAGLARAVTQYYVEAQDAGVAYGFYLNNALGYTSISVTNPCTAGVQCLSDQIWMTAAYDMGVLYRYQQETNDAPLGNPPITPTRVISAFGQTLLRASTLSTGADGTATTTWPNALLFTFTGSRLGGTLASIDDDPACGNPSNCDRDLYNTNKSMLDATLVRAGDMSGNASLSQMGSDMVTLVTLPSQQSEFGPLSKAEGEYTWRLHQAVARLAQGAPTSTPTPTPTPTPPPVGPPIGFFDTPVGGTTGAQGAIPVTGWALDDTGVSKVELWRDPVNGDPPPAANGKIFIGDATFVAGARPDVEALYPGYPNADRAAWGYMLLTNLLPNANTGAPAGGVGTFTLYAYAYDTLNNVTLLGTPTFSCDNVNGANKPFGTIDTPAQGETVSGVINNFGWVLTPLNGAMPTDGTTIVLFIDSIPRGTALYNLPRSDIATLFPGYANTSGPVGYFSIDTTTLANGVHTIAWSATDDLARADGIGSRYFTVQN